MKNLNTRVGFKKWILLFLSKATLPHFRGPSVDCRHIWFFSQLMHTFLLWETFRFLSDKLTLYNTASASCVPCVHLFDDMSSFCAVFLLILYLRLFLLFVQCWTVAVGYSCWSNIYCLCIKVGICKGFSKFWLFHILC